MIIKMIFQSFHQLRELSGLSAMEKGLIMIKMKKRKLAKVKNNATTVKIVIENLNLTIPL